MQRQVFTLLETIYGCFDIIAKKRGVFKGMFSIRFGACHMYSLMIKFVSLIHFPSLFPFCFYHLQSKPLAIAVSTHFIVQNYS